MRLPSWIPVFVRAVILFAAVVLSQTLPTAGARGTLEGVVLDPGTGERLPSRVYVRSLGDGSWHHVESKGGQAVTYHVQRGRSVESHTSLSADPFVVRLPAGDYIVTVERGKEWLPVEKRVTVEDDATASVRMALHRWIDMQRLGWFSGETHVHRLVRELPTLLLAEDLNVGLPITAWVTDTSDTPLKNNRNPEPLPARALIKVDDTHVIWPVNTEYEIFSVNKKQHTLGAVFILDHKEPLDFTVPPVGPVAAAARAQGALLDLDKHNWPWSMMLVPEMKVDLFELTNNHVWRARFLFSEWYTGYVPAYMGIELKEGRIDERGWIDFGFQNYYALLNCGFDLKPSAGTASGVHPVPLGFGRVYVRLKGEFSYTKWIKGLAAGRSFVTTGPMLTATFNGHDPGHRFVFADLEADRSIQVSGRVESIHPLRSLEVLVNGKIMESIPVRGDKNALGTFSMDYTVKVPLQESAWLAVRAFEKIPRGRERFAHTAPVHVTIPDRPLRPRRAEVEYLIGRVKDEIRRSASVLSEDQLAEFRNALGAYEALREKAR